MVIDARDKFAYKAALMLLQVGGKLKGEGLDPSPEMDKRTANYTPEFDAMVQGHILNQASL